MMTEEEIRQFRDMYRSRSLEKGVNELERANNRMIALVLSAVLQDDDDNVRF